MKKLFFVLTVLMMGAASIGCTSIASHQGTSNNHWVVQNTGMAVMGMGLILDSEIFYCPPSGAACVKAEIE